MKLKTDGERLQDRKVTRRQAVGVLATAGAVFGLGVRVRAAGAPEKVRLAFIGVGGRGRSNIGNFSGQEFVAFADVDDARAAEIYKQHPQVPHYRDYRRMLERHANDIDGVVVSTPDHLHHPMALAVLAAGKHIYLEKPLAPTIAECRDIARAAAERKVVTQLGVHGHAFEALRVLREWIEAGAVGRIERVIIWSDRFKPSGYVGADADAEAMPVPPTLDWAGWLGNRRPRAYSSRYLPSLWRNWWDFGGGPLADIAVHNLDAVGFALDLGYPEVVTAEVSDRRRMTSPQWTKAEWIFPARQTWPRLPVAWVGGWKDGALLKPEVPRVPAELVAKTDNGMAFVGREGTLFIPDMRASVRPRIYPLAREKEFLAAPPARTLPRPKGGHHQEWLEAIRAGRPAGAPFDYGARLTETVILGALAQRTGKPVRWDPRTMRCAGNPDAEALLRPEVKTS